MSEQRQELSTNLNERFEEQRQTMTQDFRNIVGELLQNGSRGEPNGSRREQSDTDNIPLINPANSNACSNNACSSNSRHNDYNLPNNSNILNTEPNNKIKPPTFDGLIPWSQYHKQFNVAANHNNWSLESKGAHLVSCLRGKALEILEY